VPGYTRQVADDALTFLAICRHGSFVAAAEALGVADSTVSRRLDHLEARLGTRLVERSTRGLTLTEAGCLYREQVQIAADALRHGEDVVRAWMRRPAGRLRIAAPSAMVRFFLAPLVVSYLERFPDVALEVVGTDEDVVPDGTTLHLAVRASLGEPPGHLKQRTLGVAPMVVAAAPSWVEAHGPVSSPEDLTRHGCIVLGSTPDAARVRMFRGDEECRITVPIALFTTSLALARRAALAGLGPVGLPRRGTARLLEAGTLVELLPGWTLASVPVVALYAGDRKLPLRVRAFLDALVEAFED
jgi:DNA-binding transcriptional LysR family regulator